MKSDFVKWVTESYKNYGDTHIEIINTAMYFAEKGMFHEYCDYLKSHFNKAFAEWEDVEEEVLARSISGKLSGEAKEVLDQIVSSPKFDGDVASKHGKSELFRHGLILRIANKNCFGDNAANNLGFLVWKVLQSKT